MSANKRHKVLLVDDDAAAHTTMALVMTGLPMLGEQIQMMHAVSASEAERTLQLNPDIAVVLLDLGLEFDQAGLRLIERVRDKEPNHSVQFILITGNSKSAPVIDTVDKYEIFDYIEKRDLTRSRLYVSLRSAMRSYMAMTELNQFRFKDSETLGG